MSSRVSCRAWPAVLLGPALLTLPACSTSVLNLEVGHCIVEESGAGRVAGVQVVDCAEPHRYEVYLLPQLPDGDFPSDDTASRQADQTCAGPEFATYVGLPHGSSGLDYTYLRPTAETWATGDREIVCLLTHPDGAELVGSMRGANR